MGWLIFFGIILFVFLIFKAVEWENNKQKERTQTLEQKFSEIENFNVSRKINGFNGFYIFAIDEVNEKIALVTETSKEVANFSDIIGVDLIEDENTISKRSLTRTIGGAIIGGALSGGAGTIVGGLSGSTTQKKQVSTISIKILLRSMNSPSISIACFNARTMTAERKASVDPNATLDGRIYQYCKKNGDDIKDLITVIIDRIDSKSGILPSDSVEKKFDSIADELIKLNELRDKGILTDDEFTIQKNKILNR